MNDKDETVIETSGLAWRVSLSIIMGVGWLVFLILWLTFVAPGFTLYQNLAVIFVSILIVGAVLGAAWASWGIKYGCRFEKEK